MIHQIASKRYARETMALGSQQQGQKRSLDPDSGPIDGERWLVSIGYTEKNTKNVMVCAVFWNMRESIYS